MRSVGPARRVRRVVPACLAGGSARMLMGLMGLMWLMGACASPPDLTALADSRSFTPPASSSTDPHGSPGTSNPGTPADTTPAPEWSNTGSAQPPEASQATSSPSHSGVIRPVTGHPGRDITLGENVDLTDEPGYPDIAVTVAGVTRNATCPQGPPPRLGQYVALDLIVRRTQPHHDMVGIPTFEWVALGPDGTATKTYGLSGFLCQRATEQFPLRFGARDEVRAQLILDVPSDTVTVTATSPWEPRAARLLIPVRQPG